MIETITNLFLEHMVWVFSGIGTTILAAWLFKSSNESKKQSQKSGHNSTNIQVGGNVEIHKDTNK